MVRLGKQDSRVPIPKQHDNDLESTVAAWRGSATKIDIRDAWDEPGVLADSAASIIMKVMYGARMARFDLLRAVQGLARHMTKWTRRQDQELWKMMCYIKATKHWRLTGWVGDPLQDITPTVFSDSDFAGCIETRRCTSGGSVV